MYSKRIIPVLLLVLGVSACQKANEEGVLRNNRISFGASTEYENFARTRTEYSGLDENDLAITSSSQHERIDWVADKDRIQILCNQTRDVDDNANPSGTFKVVTASNEGDEKSYADVEAVGGTPFYWGSGMHYFYALYPAAGTTSNYHDGEVTDTQSAITSTSATTARIDGTIPAAQSLVKSGNIYKPNMNYAYMYAATKTEKTDSRSVVLPFTPLVTCFEFQLKALDDAMASSDLTTLTLSSTTSSMTGAFSAALDLDGTNVATVTPASGAGKTITVSFPADTRLSKTNFIIATALALGVEQTNLTLTLAFANGTIRSLVLNRKSDSQPVTVAACKKVYFQLGVDAGEWTYFLSDPLAITKDYFGGTGNLGSGFVSYRQNSSGTVKEAVPFVLEYSATGAEGTWSTSCPWITANGVDYNGSVTGQNFTATLNGQVNSGSDPQRDILKARTPVSGFDLSTKNVATGGTVARTTANCYVVDAPGTYKFPLVYGNGVKDGSFNERAYRGSNGTGGSYWGDGGASYTDVAMGQSGMFLGRFKDHANNNITNPYIAQTYSTNLNAILLWQDSPGLVVVDAAITGSGTEAYLTFTVNQETINEGNALVAVRSGSTILWSWHIWVTPTNLAAGAAGPSGKVFSPVNLGWCVGKTVKYDARQYYVRARQTDPNGNTSVPKLIQQTGYNKTYKGNNTYYEWGRKDPMQAGDGQNVGSDGTQNFKPYFSDTGYTPSHVGRSLAGNLGVAIQNPHIEFNTNHENNANGQYDWVRTSYSGTEWIALNLWDSGAQYMTWVLKFLGYNYYGQPQYGFDSDKNIAAVNSNVTKTIYDPSPVGYKVPNVGAFAGLTLSNFAWTTVGGQTGRQYGSLFFPAVGGYSQALHGVNLGGAYLTATPEYPDGSVDAMTFAQNDDPNLDGDQRLMYTKAGDQSSYAFTQRFSCWCVRPIKE